MQLSEFIPGIKGTHVITFSFVMVVEKIHFQLSILQFSLGANMWDAETEACALLKEGIKTPNVLMFALDN